MKEIGNKMGNLFKKARDKDSLTKAQVKHLLDAIDRLEDVMLAIMKRLSPEEQKLVMKDYKFIQALSKKSDK